DNGGEYMSTVFLSFLQECGILFRTLCAHTPQQNGITKRKNRHLLEVARALLLGMHLPKHFWGDALLTATFLINCIPSCKVLGCTFFV
ncbi:hypothetical protein PJP10_31855, partial [Mycobacterium kansasii]